MDQATNLFVDMTDARFRNSEQFGHGEFKYKFAVPCFMAELADVLASLPGVHLCCPDPQYWEARWELSFCVELSADGMKSLRAILRAEQSYISAWLGYGSVRVKTTGNNRFPSDPEQCYPKELRHLLPEMAEFVITGREVYEAENFLAGFPGYEGRDEHGRLQL